MKNKIIKISALILLFFSIQISCFATTFENLKIEIDKNIVHPKEEVTLKVDFGRLLSEFEINIAYDKNLFQYYSASKDINLYDNGDVVTITYPTMSTKEPISEIEISFKANEQITTSNPTDLKVTVQKAKDGFTNEIIENPLLPIEKKIIVEPIYKDYQFLLEHDETLISNEHTNMKLILKSDMGQIYKNVKIYAKIINQSESEVQITATDLLGKKYNILEEGWGGENGESIGGSNVLKELNLNSIFSDSGNYKITFELQDLNNSNFVIASKSFNLIVSDKILNTDIDNSKLARGQVEETQNKNQEKSLNKISSTTENVNNTNEVIYKPTTLPKAGSTIYFLILPIGGILILIYCVFKKKDENF